MVAKTFSFSNIQQFVRKLDKSAEDMEKRVIDFQRFLTLELLRRVVLRTPVDTGRARGAWLVSIGNPPTGRGRPDPGGTATVAAGANKLRSLKRLGPPTWVSNSVPYILVLEGGSSKQAPNGMMAVAMAEIGTVL